MTAVAPPPPSSFSSLNKAAWGSNGSQTMNSEDVRGMFTGRKNLQRTNSSSSVSSTGSSSSTTTVATTSSQLSGTPASSTGGLDVSQWPNPGGARKRPQPSKPWPPGKGDGQPDFSRLANGRSPQSNMSLNGLGGQPMGAGQGSMPTAPMGMPRGNGDQIPTGGQPVLYLLSLNGTFERKTIQVPFGPESLRIGRQTNQKTVPTPLNGFFDSKVLSRQHAEIWAERNGKIFIRDVKSSNGTFVNGTRLSPENRESEPHELQTADHLELGIDIVSEDQKTVVHHKVAAKVEHAGFLSSSNNLLDVNFGDLDPGNGTMMIPSQLANQLRGRNGNNLGGNGRMPGQGLMVGPTAGYRPQQHAPTTDLIIKKIQTELRAARLQAADLGRTDQFVNTLLSKDDVKDQDKTEADQKQPMVNGAAIPFRSDPKTRFSDPPAPPPQQPLPEKPDIPGLKRGTTERPKSHPPNSSPTRESVPQILQLQEDLKTTRQALESRDAKLRELEDAFLQERQAREKAEHLARTLEETAAAAAATAATAAAAATATAKMNGTPKINGSDPLLDAAFDPPQDAPSPVDAETPTSAVGKTIADHVVDKSEIIAAEYRAQLDAVTAEMRDMKAQLQSWMQRCQKAEEERDANRAKLEDMVLRIRTEEEARIQAEEAAKTAAAEVAATREKSRGRSKDHKETSAPKDSKSDESAAPPPQEEADPQRRSNEEDGSSGDSPIEPPKLSRDTTITPQLSQKMGLERDQTMIQAMPYASMLGVVLLGIGLMSYINGWQGSPKVDR